MAQFDLPLERIMAALQPLREGLEADGYDLTVQSGATGLVFRVEAKPGACEECLVPKPLFLSLITQAMDDARLDCSGIPLELVYPLEGGHC